MARPAATGCAETSFEDRFVLDRMPPRDLWPDGIASDRPAPLNVAHWIRRRARRGGWMHRPAILSPGRQWTYADLFRHVDLLARNLIADGLRPGGRVLLRGQNSADMIALWLAVVQAGGVVVTTIPLLRAKELAEIIEIGEIDLAYCQPGLVEELEEAIRRSGRAVKQLRYGPGVVEGRSPARTEPSRRRTLSDDPCLIGFTSGTTGNPKATIHSHANLRAAYRTTGRHAIGIASDDVVMCPAPLGFTFGLSAGLLYPLAGGAAIIPVAQPTHEGLKAAMLFSPTILFASPLLYRRFLDSYDPRDWPALHSTWSGGDMLQQDLQLRWNKVTGIPLHNIFGTTELFHAILNSGADANSLRPVRGYQAAVLTQDGRLRRRGSGMLLIKGPTGCRYLADERQRHYVHRGWNLTGDRAVIGADKTIRITGRREDVIVSAGYNISAAEIEETILKLDEVAECAVVGVEDQERGQVAVAFVVLGEDQSPGNRTAERIQNHVKAELAPYKYPRAINFIAALPRGATGKVQRHLLR